MLMTYFERLKARERDDDTPIEDLCRPLSAKVLPRRAQIGAYGDELSLAKAIGIQRQTHRQGASRTDNGRATT